MAEYRIERTHKRHVAIMFPDGRVIATTDEEGKFETDCEEAMRLFTEHPAYHYVKLVGEKDATE